MIRCVILTLGLALATLCAFAVSASATIDLARQHGMHGFVPYALVGVLELLSLGCAYAWVTSTGTWVEVEFAGVMGLASAVSIVGGVQAYQWLGIVAPIAMVASVHVTSRMWLVSTEAPAEQPIPAEPPIVSPTTDSVSTTPVPPAPPESDPEPITDWSSEPSAAPPVARPGPTPSPIPDDEAERVADLRAHAAALGKMPGRDAVKARYGVGSTVADRLREQAAKPQLTLTRGGGA